MPRPDDLSTLAGRIAYAMKRRGVIQATLAERAGVQQPAISKLVTGKMQKTTAIARLSAALDVPPEWLEHGTGPEPRWQAGEPVRPPADFSEANKAPSASDWALLEALKWLPDNEVEELRQDVFSRAAKYEEFVQKQTEKIGRREVRAGREYRGGINSGFGPLAGEGEESADG